MIAMRRDLQYNESRLISPVAVAKTRSFGPSLLADRKVQAGTSQLFAMPSGRRQQSNGMFRVGRCIAPYESRPAGARSARSGQRPRL